MVAVILAVAEEEPRIHIPHLDELIWGSLAFLILFVTLAKFAFPKVQQMLDQRAEKIRSGLEAAEKTKSEAEAMLEQYRRQLAEARGEAQKIIEEAKRTAESLRRDLVARAEQESQDIVARARADVAGERDRAVQELRATIGDLSIQLATRVIERELSQPESQRAFVDRTIEELGSLGNGSRS